MFIHAGILQPHFPPVMLNKTSDSPSTWLSWVTFTPFQYQTRNNSARLQPPASDLCSPSGRLFILLTLLMLLFHVFWLPLFTSQEGNSSFHANPRSPSTRSHLALKAHRATEQPWILSSHPTYTHPQITPGKYLPQLSFSVSCWTKPTHGSHSLAMSTENPAFPTNESKHQEFTLKRDTRTWEHHLRPSIKNPGLKHST